MTPLDNSCNDTTVHSKAIIISFTHSKIWQLVFIEEVGERDRLCRKQQHSTVTLSDISGSADFGESPMHFCYSCQVATVLEKKIGIRMDRNSRQVATVLQKKIGIRMDRNSCQVATVLEKKIGIRMDRKGLLLLLKRAALLRKIRLHGEGIVLKRE
jgi:hypothetical protein